MQGHESLTSGVPNAPMQREIILSRYNPARSPGITPNVLLKPGKVHFAMPASIAAEPQSQQHESTRQTERSYRWFPGWTMLGISAAAQYMSAPGQSYSVAALKDPMQADLAVSETQYSLAYACATVISAAMLPYIGRLVDRFGARITLPLIAIGLGAGCWMMSSVESLTGLYVGFGIVRCLGQGALSLVSAWIVGEWFERRRGIATAMAGLGGGLSVMSVPLINNWFVENYGWQSAWQGLACGVWVLLLLPGIFILRNRPEDLGLHPDGTPPESDSKTSNYADTSTTRESSHTATQAVLLDESTSDNATQSPNTAQATQDKTTSTGPVITSFENSWTVHEVLRNPTFWKLLCVPATSGLVGTGLIIHQVRLLERHGLDRTESLLMMTLQAGCATVMQFPAGWLTDRVPSRYILAAAMMFLAMATLLAIDMPFIGLAGVYAMLLGLHGSIMRSTATVVWINYYGRAHQGAVRGVAWSAMILAAAIGPLPLAISNDYYGAYEPALIMFLALPLLAAAAVWTAHPPQRAR